ncbi:XRE family transcriptional regulator [Kitasatospora purpeofusca]|uniref:XRE family transcriptional regulator n=1 Tax=Kitasatospora purpeofusca TaxID=67352 RepID=UPI0035DFB032
MNHKQRAQRDLADARARLAGHLRERIPTLTRQQAETLLEQARVWGPGSARELDQHFAEHPNALTAPSPHCPTGLVRLLQQLAAAGHGEAVTQLACAICGRADRDLKRRTPQGRCCGWCVHRTELRPCARCGLTGVLVRKAEEGSICRRCYERDDQRRSECAGCGRLRPASHRTAQGEALCQACSPKPERDCVRCGNTRPVQANTEDGPVCKTCYESPPRLCGRCHRIRPIARRADGGRPDLCAGCYLGGAGDCVVCGRHRPGRHVGERDGAFHCSSCIPRSRRQCGDCGRHRPVRAQWPLGPVCDGCYDRRKRRPAPCSRCQQPGVLVGRADDGTGLCGPCCGTDITFTCNRCGFPGGIYADGACNRCIASERLRDLLGQEDGTISPALRPLADALVAAASPTGVLQWLRVSSGPRLLAELASQNATITHASLDALPQDPTTRHLRELLLATGILPRRPENLARLEVWFAKTVQDLPPHQARIIHPFAEWGIIRDARRRSARGRYRIAAAATDRADIRTAIEFLTWLDDNQLDLDTVRQEDLDLWLTTNPTRYRSVTAFIRWATARRLITGITLANRRSGPPSQFMGQGEHQEQLKRCLNDETLPLEVRIAGALVGLYALPLTRIAELTCERFHRDGGSSYLTIERNPVLLPPKLAQLIERQIDAQPEPHFILKTAKDSGPAVLFPGRFPGKPRSVGRLHELMKRHELPVITARNTAMLEAVADLPPIVISDLFGINPSTAHSWARLAQNSWTDYLAALQEE